MSRVSNGAYFGAERIQSPSFARISYSNTMPNMLFGAEGRQRSWEIFFRSTVTDCSQLDGIGPSRFNVIVGRFPPTSGPFQPTEFGASPDRNVYRDPSQSFPGSYLPWSRLAHAQSCLPNPFLGDRTPRRT